MIPDLFLCLESEVDGSLLVLFCGLVIGDEEVQCSGSGSPQLLRESCPFIQRFQVFLSEVEGRDFVWCCLIVHMRFRGLLDLSWGNPVLVHR